MPFDSALACERSGAEGPDLDLIQRASVQFAAAHPYLLFRRDAVGRIRRRAAGSAKLQARLSGLLGDTGKSCDPQDLRAAIKRRARHLIATSFAALTGEGECRERALAVSRASLAELAAASSWKERPVIKSFLDCAEIAIAVAFAYDWLYDWLSSEERVAVEQAILRQVLTPALAAYQDPSALWPWRRDNCCLVSNSGVLIAALAVLPCFRGISSALMGQSLSSAWNVFAAFAPDGAWPEGPSYWSLAVRYAGLMVAGLESTFGDSFGLADRPGFAQTGDFALHAAGPTGAAFNFGDSVDRFDASALAWLAHRFGRPIDSWLFGGYDGSHLPLTTIWPKRPKAGPAALGLPTGKLFRGSDLACLRNTWRRDRRARPVYLAIKGGNPGAGESPGAGEEVFLHAQADAGSFILDGARHRWIIDLGSDDYDLPGYFDLGPDNRSGRRWRYYRTRTAGHNTLVFDGQNQDPNARTQILGAALDGACKWIVYDLSAAYGRPAGTVRRGAALIGRQVVISDEIGPNVAADIVWTVHTSAEPVFVAGTTARFRLGDDRLLVHILEPHDAHFVLTAPPPPGAFRALEPSLRHGSAPPGAAADWIAELPRRSDEGEARAAGAPIRRLQIAWPQGARRLTVLLLPDCDGAAEATALPVTPLDYWLARRPLRLTHCPRPDWRKPGARPGPVTGQPSTRITTLAPVRRMSVDHV